MPPQSKSDLAELWMVLHQSAASFQRARNQLCHHEHFIGNIVLGSKSFQTGGREAEARVIIRVPQHNDDAVAKALALFEAFPYQLRADSLILVFRQDRHRRKTHRGENAVL